MEQWFPKLMGTKIKGCYNVNFWFSTSSSSLFVYLKLWFSQGSGSSSSGSVFCPLVLCLTFINSDFCLYWWTWVHICPYILWSETSLGHFSWESFRAAIGRGRMGIRSFLKCSHELEGGFGGNFKNIIFIHLLLALGLLLLWASFLDVASRTSSSCRAQALGTWASAVVMQELSCSSVCGIFLE